MPLKIGTHEIETIAPVSMRDAMYLDEKHGIDLMQPTDFTKEQMVIFAHRIVTKTNPEITFDEVCDAPLSTLVKIVQQAWGADEDFLALSISSPKNGAGEKSKSKN